jgi:hypothetical protein
MGTGEGGGEYKKVMSWHPIDSRDPVFQIRMPSNILTRVIPFFQILYYFKYLCNE